MFYKYKAMKKKYVKLTWNGGKILELTWEDYLINKTHWDNQQCIKSEYWK